MGCPGPPEAILAPPPSAPSADGGATLPTAADPRAEGPIEIQRPVGPAGATATGAAGPAVRGPSPGPGCVAEGAVATRADARETGAIGARSAGPAAVTATASPKATRIGKRPNSAAGYGTTNLETAMEPLYPTVPAGPDGDWTGQVHGTKLGSLPTPVGQHQCTFWGGQTT